MFVATNCLKVQKGHGADLESRFAQTGGVEGQPGFVSFALWKLDEDADHEEYLVVTHWESKDAHGEYVKSEAFREAHAGPRLEALIGRAEPHGYEVRLTSQPAEAKVHS